MSRKYGSHRTGRLIEVETESGLVGWGDAAPLEGFSLESVDDIDRLWPRISSELTTVGFDSRFITDEAPPSVLFAVEQTQLSIRGQNSGVSPASTIDPLHRDRIKVAGLVDTPAAEALDACRDLVRRGFQSIKVKTGHWHPNKTADFIAGLRTTIPDNVGVHVDANRAWSFNDAKFILASAGDSGIEYVEEPLHDPSRLPELADSISTPIALDESLANVEPAEVSALGHAGFVILKPTLLGGIARSMQYAVSAREAGMTALVSSSIESGLGLLWLVALAASRQLGEPAGLDTYGYLETDTLRERLDIAPEIETSITTRVYQPPVFDE